MRRKLWFISLVLAFAYVGMCLFLYFFQRALLYFPTPPAALCTGVNVTLQLPDVALTLTTRPRPGAKALIYFGGNAEDVSFSLPDLAEAYPEHTLYLMHYRGYSGSGGKPSEAALHGDAEALYDHIRSQHSEIIVVGRSLGSGVAIRLASARTVSRLVLVTPYDSIEHLAARKFPLFPIQLILQDKFESWRYAAKITVPTLLIVAGDDDLVPRWSSDALLQAFPRGLARLQAILHTDHNSITESPEYVALLRGSL